jgi:SPP1 family predicted phage head-tail adaptor
MIFSTLTAGDLRHKITIQHKVITTDSEGIPHDGFVDYMTCYAMIIPLGGREVFLAQATQGVNPVMFRVRYNPNIDNTMRIVYLGNKYRITAYEDANMRHKELQIMTLQEVQNG